MRRVSFVLLPLLLLASPVHSEYGCQSGFVPVYQNGRQVCVADYNLPVWSQGRGVQVPQQLWESSWGAIAVDNDVGAFGIVENRESKRAARKAAIEDCKQHGGVKCTAPSYYANQCVVMIASSGGYEITYGADKIAKEREGMAKCTGAGYGNCRVYYSGCSWPRRVK